MTLSGEEGFAGSTQQVFPNAPDVTITDCFGIGAFGFSLHFDCCDDFSADLDFSMAGLIDSVPGIIMDGIQVSPSQLIPQPCGNTVIEDYGRVSGGFSLYAVSFGTETRFVRKATSEILMNDTVIITSGTNGIVELHFGISGSMFAAESFGSVTDTYGKARLALGGTVDGVSLGPLETAIESVTVIPELGSINESVAIVIPVSVGDNVIPISVTGTAEVEVSAKCAGLFCSLTGSATAGINPGFSISLGPFTGSNGAPLPNDIVITSMTSGITYPGAGPLQSCNGDVDGDCDADSDDLATIRSLFGSMIGDTDFNPDADLDGNGVVDQLDEDLWIALYECPTDATGDGVLDLADLMTFVDCLSGPGVPPTPGAPTTAQDCLNSFDCDHDSDIDVSDFTRFQITYGR